MNHKKKNRTIQRESTTPTLSTVNINNHNLNLARWVCDHATDSLMSVKNILIANVACTGRDLRRAICALNGIAADDIVHFEEGGGGLRGFPFLSSEIVHFHLFSQNELLVNNNSYINEIEKVHHGGNRKKKIRCEPYVGACFVWRWKQTLRGIGGGGRKHCECLQVKQKNMASIANT